MKEKNKAILLINLTGEIGGAEKRYISLYNYIIRQRNDYYLIINNGLYENFKKNGLLNNDKNIILLKLDKDKSNLTNCAKENNKTNDSIKNKNGIKSFFGKNKYFLRLAFKWMSFAIQIKKILILFDNLYQIYHNYDYKDSEQITL